MAHTTTTIQQPTYGIIDSQSTKTMGKTKGRKRHIVTATMGHLLAITVHAANIHDTVGGVDVYDKVVELYPSIKGMCGDMGYRGTFVSHVNRSEKIRHNVTNQTEGMENHSQALDYRTVFRLGGAFKAAFKGL